MESRLDNKHKFNKYFNFLKITALTIILCVSINPLRDFVFILGDYRLPLTEDGIFYSYQHKEAYALQAKQPKIVIAAGSSALLGLSAEQIEFSTGNPTVNFGTHAALGLGYILYKAKSVLKPGDTVLLPLEFELYHEPEDDQLTSAVLRRHAISYDKGYISDLDWIRRVKFWFYPSGFDENRKLLKAILQNKLLDLIDKRYVRTRVLEAARTGNCYTGMTLNRNGDETCNVGKSPIDGVEEGKIHLGSHVIDPANAIKKFLTFAKNNNIAVIPMYPTALSIPEYQSYEYKKYFLEIKKFWLDQGIAFEDSVDKMLLPKEMMFDTYYHPNDEGRRFRTTNIISLIK